jgi:predicted nucleotidyltransferase
MPLEDFVTVEKRKVLQGRFGRHDFFIRCLKEASEVQEHYGDVTYRRVGYGKMRAVVSREDEAIFTPCRYGTREAHFLEGESDRDVTAIASFRGRFCEQAMEGESVVAQGKIEECSSKSGEKSLRLLLGERKSDFMCLTGRTT